MPGVDGYQIAASLKQAVPGTRLVAFSGWRLDPHEQKVREAGVDAFFTKPLDPEKLGKYLAELKK
jgi:CheY-like chemotaxis protein